MAIRAARPAIHHRKSPRWRRQYRHRGGRARSVGFGWEARRDEPGRKGAHTQHNVVSFLLLCLSPCLSSGRSHACCGIVSNITRVGTKGPWRRCIRSHRRLVRAMCRVVETHIRALFTAWPARCAGKTLLCRLFSHSPCQKTKSNALADEFYAEQYANEPDRGDGNVGPKIESQQNPDDPARQDPTPVRKGPYRQRKDHLRNTLDHEEHNQQKRERNEALRR